MRSKYYGWCRCQRTTAEKRANQVCYEHDLPYKIRGKRRPKMLPDAYWDRPTTTTKCWKDHRKTQYRAGKRGKKHTIYIPHTNDSYMWGRVWNLQQYFRDNDIPYCVKRDYEKTTYWQYRDYRLEEDGQKELFPGYFVPTYKKIWFWLDEPKKVSYSSLKGYWVSWWSDKDIGIEYES